jgi:FtsH-binding integral membrane protein
MALRNPQEGIVYRDTAARAEIDQGLRAYMLKVYTWMALGLALTGAVAFAASSSTELMRTIYTTPLKWVVILAPLAVVFFFSFRIHKMSAATAQGVFWLYAALNGLAFSYIFLAYTGTSIAKVFFISAATFGAMSLYGYTTKADLSRFGSFLFMGLIGIIIAMLVNIFLQSSALGFAISVIGVLIFVGLTAYDTQKIKEMYDAGDDGEVLAKKGIMGALSLYLDFLNIFLFLLQLFGDRR